MSFLLISHSNPPHNCVWNKQFAAIVCYVLFQARASQTEPSNACEWISYPFVFLDGALIKSEQTWPQSTSGGCVLSGNNSAEKNFKIFCSQFLYLNCVQTNKFFFWGGAETELQIYAVKIWAFHLRLSALIVPFFSGNTNKKKMLQFLCANSCRI